MEEFDIRVLEAYDQGCESFLNVCGIIIESDDGEGTEMISRETGIIEEAMRKLESLAPGSREYADLLGKRQAIKEALETPYRFDVFIGWMDRECARQMAANPNPGRY